VEAGGGLALCGRAGSPLNKVLGLGLDGPVADADLDRIDALYAERNVPAQVELCPLAAPELPARLVARGYVPIGFETELGLPLGPDVASRVGGPEGAVRVTRVGPDEEELWLRVVAEGFAAAEAPVAQEGAAGAGPSVDDLIGVISAFSHPQIRRYLARIDGEAAGGGAAWLHEGVLGIFGCATREAYRRRGVQTAVTVASIRDAGEEADLVITTTAPGSTSQRTFERLGFRVLYTRLLLLKAPPATAG
jgi:ribosomal protein S18 acetylase RimI-like enzyme